MECHELRLGVHHRSGFSGKKDWEFNFENVSLRHPRIDIKYRVVYTNPKFREVVQNGGQKEL